MAQSEISPPQSAASKRLRPKTYILAVYITLAVALIQVLVLGSIFWLRHKVKIDTHSPAPAVGHEQIPVPQPSAPVVAPAGPAPITLEPTLGAARLPVPVDPARHIADLDQEAYGYMQQGEYDLARVALLEAENIDARNVLTLRYEAELAEAEADWSRAAGYWQRLVDLSSDAGDLKAVAPQRLAAARAHLMAATLAAAQAKVSPPPAPVKPVAPFTNSVAASHPAPSSVPTPSAPAPTQVQASAPAPAIPAPGVPSASASSSSPNAVFHVSPTETVPLTGNATLTGFTLRLPIVPANVTQGIDPGKVGIKLFFYDQIQGGVIVPTNAHLNVAFEDPRATWLNGRTEVLRAVYQRTADPTPGAQSYYGYLFRLYYDGSLVEERANPQSLLALFPAAP